MARRLTSSPVIFGPAIRGLKDHDTGQLGQRLLHPVPEKDRDVLGGWVRKPLDVIKTMMIEPFEQRLESRLDGEEIGNEAGCLVDRALEPQFHPVGMAMEPAAAVPLGNPRQEMRGFEMEGLRDLHGTSFGFMADQ